jgi:putative DNA primase/helicase
VIFTDLNTTPPPTSQPPTTPPPTSQLADPKYSDLGNAERLVGRYGDQLRYVPEWGWCVWDGARWAKDETRQVMERAKEMVRGLRQDAANTSDSAHRNDLWRHAVRSEAKARLEAMIDLAQSDPAIVRRAEAFDSDPFLLNVANGTIDLRTGELRPHDPADHITKLCPVAYDPEARSGLLGRFLLDVFRRDKTLICYMQRAIGYSLTGSVREPAYFIPWGSGRNGKSTLFNAVEAMLGGYAASTPIQTFERKQFSGGATNDLAALVGARFIMASESEQNRTLDISLVKRWTGGDKITARFLNKEFFSYLPQGKAWMPTNNKPTIPETSPAVWQRVKLIPFTESFVGREDVAMPSKLASEEVQRALLAWAVRGCRDWLAGGLQDPEVVRDATQAYQAEEDELAGFFEEHCVFGPTLAVQSSRLYEVYSDWAKENRIQAVSSTKFAPLMTGYPAHTISKGKATSGPHNHRMVFKGIGVATDERRRAEQASASGSQPDDQPQEIPF